MEGFDQYQRITEEKEMIEKIKQALLYGKDFCEDTAENIKETVVTAVDATKLQYRITAQRNELNSLYGALGRDAYAEMNGGIDGILSEDETARICSRIAAKEEILKDLERQYRMVSGKVICPSCGKFISDVSSFCPFCGRATDISADYDGFDADLSDDELEELREIEEL